MDANFHSLPPLKRFRILQQQQQLQEDELCKSEPEPKPKPETPKSKPMELSPSNLPTKKRKLIRDPFFDSNAEKENIPPTLITPPATPFCLPAKKRIWAFRPEISPAGNTPPPSPPFDLNLEYNPSPDPKGSPARIEPVPEDEVKEEEEEDEEEGDDGILCAVCESTDGDETDPIVFCDGCDLMVHSTCYGNPLIKGIPEGEWLCYQCSNSRPSADKGKDSIIRDGCCLCPASGGAMKPTRDGRMAHIVCALLVPEVFFEDPEGRDGIDCSKVPKRRWRQKCYVCKERKGCAVECSEAKCPLAFHVSCGLKQELSIELKEGKNSGGIVAGFCKKHTELWKKQQKTGKYKIVARDED